MKTLIIAIAFVAIFFTSPSHGADVEHKHEGQALEPSTSFSTEKASCENIINIKVNGLVCDFCARSLEKVFLKRDDVAGIKVDLSKSSVVVATKSGLTIDDTSLKNLIKDSGYNVTTIDRGCKDE